MNKFKNKSFNFIIYIITIFLIFSILIWLGHYNIFKKFITKMENSSFDIRQSIISKYKKPNDNIVIIVIDDASYEYIMDKIGTWPISRLAWANTISALETVNPKYIAFDMLFLKPYLNDTESDNHFAATVAQYNNLYFAMNFDNYPDEIRLSKNLDEKFRLKVSQGALSDNEYITYANARMVMPQLAMATNNIGSVNVVREEDGVIRNFTPIFKYKRNYYPNMSLIVGMDELKADSIGIKNNTVILDKKHTIPLDKTKRAIINWYSKQNGQEYTYKQVPFWEVLNAILNNNIDFLEKNFKNKIIYIGTTATSLNDIKTTPISENMAGVEIHATFLNNILDNNFIKRTSGKIDIFVAIILSFIVGYYVLKTISVAKSFIFLLSTILLYLFIATFVMHIFNIWVGIILPVVSILVTFTFAYCEKYLSKAKDYEQTYKLAVTDGLTQLYNHRYFQEQMIANLSNFKRYQTVFSLILIDIDFFKKFNDTYGHQSGDAVLKQVADILIKNIRTSDIACRYGGEEMSIILTNTGNKEAIITANKICEAVRNKNFIVATGQKVKVTISVGVATVSDNLNEVQAMIEYSDKCLYKAKESGRNQVVHEF